jgi:hypothetical protein
MASQYILDRLVDVGDVANDGSGDDLREAFIKINENIQYVGDRIGEAVGGVNLGLGEPIYSSVASAVLSFRSIGAAGNLSVSTVNDVITLRFNPNSAVNFNGQDITGIGDIIADFIHADVTGNVIGDLRGSVFAEDSTLLVDAETQQFFGTLHGNVTGNLTGNVLGDVTGDVLGDVTGDVLGDVTGDVTGDLTGNVTGLIRATTTSNFVDVNNIEDRINTFDYGVINPVGLNSFKDPGSYLLFTLGTDMGTFNNPSEFGIDAGTL